MMKSPTVAVLHNEVGPQSAQDEMDVLVQLDAVSTALTGLGYNPQAVPVTLHLDAVIETLETLKPVLVFNLVESISGTGRFIHFVPALLDHLHIPYTGCGTDALYLTTNKVLSKEILALHDVYTPDWRITDGILPADEMMPPPYIIKPVWEDASVGLCDASVVHDQQDLSRTLHERSEPQEKFFIETFIPGREFNLSMLASPDGPEILPPAEILFIDYPEDKPKIVDYRAKWMLDSFEYQHTVRSFDFSLKDRPLINTLKKTAGQCWEIFRLRGYARVDFRVDSAGTPWVLEINANPCIAPDSGFVAASEQAGLDFTDVIRRIIEDVRPLSDRRGTNRNAGIPDYP